MRRRILLATAIAFAAVDLLHKTFTPADIHHARTPYITLLMAALIGALVWLVPHVPSNAAAVGAGVACGGALGNLVSLLAWTQGVPDPLVVVGAAHGVAFNLADVFAFAGDCVLLSAVVVHGVRRRAELHARV